MSIQLKEGVEYVCANGDGPVTISKNTDKSYDPEWIWVGSNSEIYRSDGTENSLEGESSDFDITGLWQPAPASDPRQWIDGPAPDDIPAGKVFEVQHRLVDAEPEVIPISFNDGYGIYNGNYTHSTWHNATLTLTRLPNGSPDWDNATIEATP